MLEIATLASAPFPRPICYSCSLYGKRYVLLRFDLTGIVYNLSKGCKHSPFCAPELGAELNLSRRAFLGSFHKIVER